MVRGLQVGTEMLKSLRARRLAFGSASASALALTAILTAILTPILGGCAPQAKTTAGGAADASAAQATAQETYLRAMPDDVEGQYKHAMVLRDTDAEQASRLFEHAALQGHGESAYQLGLLQTDAKRRVEWYSMAAAIGQTDAQFALGEAYLHGQGTAKEPAWGLSWFERAARAGHARAQHAMGVALMSGLSGPAMQEEALVWLLIAKQNGFADADLMIGLLQARFSPAVSRDAQERAQAWTNEPAGDAEARATTRFAQYALGRLGFDAGLADGIRGDRTDQAVSAFRVSQGMNAGGLDGRTLDLLRERLAVLAN